MSMEGEKEINSLTLQLREREEKISQLMENMKGKKNTKLFEF